MKCGGEESDESAGVQGVVRLRLAKAASPPPRAAVVRIQSER